MRRAVLAASWSRAKSALLPSSRSLAQKLLNERRIGRRMWKASSFLLVLVLGAGASGDQGPSFLPNIQARWDASDLVCIGNASSPIRTGITQFIDGANRDQLSTEVELERCFKGQDPRSSEIRVLGNYVAAAKEGDQGVISFAYSGPPTGFVHRGRNLLFLRRGPVPDEFAVTVPIYQTAIPLADTPPEYPPATSPIFTKVVLIKELENAMLDTESTGGVNIDQGFGDPLPSDIEYIDYVLDYLGTSDGIAELTRLSDTAPLAIQRDIAVKLLDHNQIEYESSVISLLLDESAPPWKRGNAALVLGRHGSHAALDPLLRVVSGPAETDQMMMFHNEAGSSLVSLKHRLGALEK